MKTTRMKVSNSLKQLIHLLDAVDRTNDGIFKKNAIKKHISSAVCFLYFNFII